MSSHPFKPCNDGDEFSGRSSYSRQSSWMSRWYQPSPKQGSLINPHLFTLCRESDIAQKHTLSHLSSDTFKFDWDRGDSSEAQSVGLLKERSMDFVAEKSKYDMFCSFSLYQERRDTSTTQMDPNQSTPAPWQKNWSILQQDSYSINRVQSPLVKSQNQFENMQRDSNLGLVRCKSSAPGLFHGCQPLEVSNVETMRVCTTVGSVENSQGGPPILSHMTHHFLFTKQTGTNLSKGKEILQEAEGSNQHRVLKFQPLWRSAFSEDKGDAKTLSVDTRNEPSAEANNSMDRSISGNKNNFSGVASFHQNEENLRDQSLLTSNAGLRRDTAWGKMPVTETTNINKELSSFPLGAGIEPSTSKTQSLEVVHLFPDTEISSKSEHDRSRDLIPLIEPSRRCVKRLKLSSSELSGLGTKSFKLEESTSHEKKNNFFFNNIGRCSRTCSGPREATGASQIVESSSARNNQNTMLQGSFWIKRWCRNHSKVTPQDNNQALVIFDPDRSKLAFHENELQKKQFPSMAAMALMGKSISGLKPYDLTRKGSLIVWNTNKQ